MWKFLENTTNSFLLLRDIFGYAVPGAVVVGMAAYRYPAISPLKWASFPPWFLVVIVIGLCYISGQVSVSLGCTLFGLTDKILKRLPLRPDASDLLYYRYLYPPLFSERDRRDTINVMRIGLGISLVIAAWVSEFPIWIADLVIGVFLLYKG